VEVYRIKDMAAALGISYSQLFRAIAAGKIQGVRWIKVGPGRVGRDFSEAEWSLIQRYYAAQPRVKRLVTALRADCKEVVA
jgi:hypothetical protein